VRLTVVVLAVAAAGGAAARNEATLPFELGIRVVYGNFSGPESWRETLERHLIDGLLRRRCYREVLRYDESDPPQPPALLLEVRIEGVSEELRFDVGMASLHDPNAPPDVARQVTARIEADLAYDLLTLPDRSVVRTRSSHLLGAHRPVFNEDPQQEARRRLLEAAVAAGESFACKGSAKKLSKQVERARNEGR